MVRSQFGLTEAITFLDDGNDAVQEAIQDVIASADSNRLKGQQVGNAVSAAIMSAGQATGEVSKLAGVVVQGVGLLVRGLVALFTVECDKYQCARPVSYHRRALVGANPPPAATLHTRDGRSYWAGQHGSLHRFLHDGTEEGGFGPSGEDTDLGRVIGVGGFTKSSQKSKRTKRRVSDIWKYHHRQKYKPDIEDGNLSRSVWYGAKLDQNPYPSGSYADRARRVYYVLRWLEKALPCRTLKCVDDALRGTTAETGITEEGKKFGAEISGQRIRGGRFYASVVQMQRDLNSGLATMSKDDAVRFLSERSAEAAAEYRKVRGKAPNRSWPFPWWTWASKLSFYKTRDALRNLAPILAAGSIRQRQIATTPAVSGRAAREAARIAPVRLNIRGVSVVRPQEQQGGRRRRRGGRGGQRQRPQEQQGGRRRQQQAQQQQGGRRRQQQAQQQQGGRRRQQVQQQRPQSPRSTGQAPHRTQEQEEQPTTQQQQVSSRLQPQRTRQQPPREGSRAEPPQPSPVAQPVGQPEQQPQPSPNSSKVPLIIGAGLLWLIFRGK